MSHTIIRVQQFMTATKQPIGNKLGDNLSVLKKRLEWLEEEVKELRKAVEEENLIEILDAFADIEYIHFGNILTFGAQNVIESVNREIHRSNMTKLMPNGEVVLREDGKIMKPITYEKPNIKRVLGL